jgi:ferredoxin--NADP+ reductase
MLKVVERSRIVPNIHLLKVAAPNVARKLEPGNFVIIKIDEVAERIPLTAADWDEEEGTVTMVFMTVGASTHRLAQLEAGDEIEALVGPLGNSAQIDNFGTVAVAMGCYGIGAVLPVARAMKKAGNRVIGLMEARSENLLYWQDKYRECTDRLVLTIYGVSCSGEGRVANVLDKMINEGEHIDRVVALGCMFMMMKTAETTRPHKITTRVSLNPIMIDGTGMCGVCRCRVGGETKFACVDGPDFDGHEVDWEELTLRRRSYLHEEVRSLSEFETRTY